MDWNEDKDTIYNAAMDCSGLFQQWLESLEPTSSDHELAEDLRGRFNLWSAYVGAFAAPKASLDARLDGHQDIKDMVLELLNMAKQNLKHKLEAKRSDAIAQFESAKETPEDLPLLLGSNAIEEAVKRLHSLGIAIRRSAARGQQPKESYDSSKQDGNYDGFNFVRYKFPHAKQSLVDQLSRSVHFRGRSMFYQQRHNKKIAEMRGRNNEAQSKGKESIKEPVESAGPEMLVTLHPPMQKNQHVLMSETNYSEINKQDFLNRMSQPRPSYSHISKGSSVRENQDEKFGYPKKPNAESSHLSVSCPVCSEPLEPASLTEKEWKAHIDRDIEPYVCISEECKDLSQSFVHLRDWKDHMQRKHSLDWAQNVHTMTWYCEMDHPGDDGDSKCFDNKGDFIQHLSATHGDTISRPQILAKARRNKTAISRDPFTCPLCDCCPEEVVPRLTEKPYELLSNHIARHLKALAFFSLSYIDYEEDSSSLSEIRSKTDWTGSVDDSNATRLNSRYETFDNIAPTIIRDIAVSVDGLQFDIIPELENPIVWPDEISRVNFGHDKTLEKFTAAMVAGREITEAQLTTANENRSPSSSNDLDGELWQIFVDKINKQYGGRMRIQEGLKGLYVRIAIRRLAQARGSRGFDNAGAIEKLLVQIRQRQALRLRREKTEMPNQEPGYLLLTKEDLIGPDPSLMARSCPAWIELQGLIGLEQVKQSVEHLIGMIGLNYQRELRDKPPLQFSLNQIFVGATGTGKTTVAKLYGQMLVDLGYLNGGDVVLKTPADFIGTSLGHSEAKTESILKATAGKVLVIDEAYMLDPGDYGREHDKFKAGIIDAIVSMTQGVPGEDRCIILVGYEDKIRDLFRNANPGLSQRFPVKNPFRFQNFTIDQSEQILRLKILEENLTYTDDAIIAARELLTQAIMRPNFTNANEISRVLSAAKMNYMARISRLAPHEDLLVAAMEATDFDPGFYQRRKLGLDRDSMLERQADSRTRSGKSRLDKLYARLMDDHPYGWALYKKVTTREIHPGSCGYFDSEGNWRSIADLSSPHDLTNQGWTVPDDGIHDGRGPVSMIWGPNCSKSIQSTCNYIGGGARTSTVAMLRTSMAISYKSKADQGAILLTENPVTRYQMRDELTAVQWMAENTSEMMRRHKDIIKTHGVWIVTKTYSTRRCAIAIMIGKTASIDITLDFADGLLTLMPHSTWTGGSGNSCTELHEDEDGVVVFFSGIYFSQELFRSKLSHSWDQEKQKDKIFRGGDDGSDGESNELDVEYWPPEGDDDEDNDKEFL